MVQIAIKQTKKHSKQNSWRPKIWPWIIIWIIHLGHNLDLFWLITDWLLVDFRYSRAVDSSSIKHMISRNKLLMVYFRLSMILTHWGWDKMAAISQTTSSGAFWWMKIYEFLLKISQKCVPGVRINNISALVEIMAWRRPGYKPLSELLMVSLLTHICVARPQWAKYIFWPDENKPHIVEWSVSCGVIASSSCNYLSIPCCERLGIAV